MSFSANDLDALPVNYVALSASSNGNNVVLAAVTGKRIVVMAYSGICPTAVNAQFISDAGGTPVNLTGLEDFGANGGICCPWSRGGWFATGVGKTLDLNLSTGVLVGGKIVYVLA